MKPASFWNGGSVLDSYPLDERSATDFKNISFRIEQDRVMEPEAIQVLHIWRALRTGVEVAGRICRTPITNSGLSKRAQVVPGRAVTR